MLFQALAVSGKLLVETDRFSQTVCVFAEKLIQAPECVLPVQMLVLTVHRCFYELLPYIREFV